MDLETSRGQHAETGEVRDVMASSSLNVVLEYPMVCGPRLVVSTRGIRSSPGFKDFVFGFAKVSSQSGPIGGLSSWAIHVVTRAASLHVVLRLDVGDPLECSMVSNQPHVFAF